MTTLNYEAPNTKNNKVLILVGVGLVLAFVLAFLFRKPGPIGLILGAQVLFLYLAFSRPVWLVASLLVVQLTASNYVVYLAGTQISTRFLWTILAFVVLLILRIKKKKSILGTGGWRVIIPAMIMFGMGIISNAINVGMAYTQQYSREVATSLVLLFLVPTVVEDKKDIKILGWVAIITCSISAVFALMQHYHFSLLPMTMTILGTHGVPTRRVIGLNDSPVDLSFTLPLVLLPAIVMFFSKYYNPRYKILFLLSLLAILAAQYYTYTRSGMYALGAGLFAIPFIVKSKYKTHLFLVAILVIASFLIYTNMKGNRYSKGVSNESSAAGRLVLWKAGAEIAMTSPVIGIGGQAFKEISQTYISQFDNSSSVVQASDVLGVEQPHNDFLRIWVNYGTIAALAFIWMIINIFRNFVTAYRRTSDRFLSAITLGCFAAFVTYCVNAFSHNVVDEVALIWVIGGLSIVAMKMTEIKKNNSPGEAR